MKRRQESSWFRCKWSMVGTLENIAGSGPVFSEYAQGACATLPWFYTGVMRGPCAMGWLYSRKLQCHINFPTECEISEVQTKPTKSLSSFPPIDMPVRMS